VNIFIHENDRKTSDKLASTKRSMFSMYSSCHNNAPFFVSFAFPLPFKRPFLLNNKNQLQIITMRSHLQGVHILVARIVTAAKEHSFRRRGLRTTNHEDIILHGQTTEITFNTDDDDSISLLEKGSHTATSSSSTAFGSLLYPQKDYPDESNSSDTTLSSSWSSLTPSEDLSSPVSEVVPVTKTEKNKTVHQNTKSKSKKCRKDKSQRSQKLSSSKKKTKAHWSAADRRAMKILSTSFLQKYANLIDENDEKALVGRSMVQKLYTWHSRRVQQVLQCPPAGSGGQLAEMARHILAYKLGHVCTTVLKLVCWGTVLRFSIYFVDLKSSATRYHFGTNSPRFLRRLPFSDDGQ
jgi:hypothetical protein